MITCPLEEILFIEVSTKLSPNKQREHSYYNINAGYQKNRFSQRSSSAGAIFRVNNNFYLDFDKRKLSAKRSSVRRRDVKGFSGWTSDKP
jgi:hypothetical protein